MSQFFDASLSNNFIRRMLLYVVIFVNSEWIKSSWIVSEEECIESEILLFRVFFFEEIKKFVFFRIYEICSSIFCALKFV